MIRRGTQNSDRKLKTRSEWSAKVKRLSKRESLSQKHCIQYLFTDEAMNLVIF